MSDMKVRQNVDSAKSIKELSVHGLFCMFNHRVVLNEKDRITIVYGPNGIGKTTLLLLLNSIFNKKFSELRKTIFSRIEIIFHDDTSLQITKKAQEKKDKNFLNLHFEYKSNEEIKSWKPKSINVNANYSMRFPLSMIERVIPSLERIRPESWLDLNSKETLSLHDVIERYGHELPTEFTELIDREIEPWLLTLLNSVSVKFIEVQRLFRLGKAMSSPGRGGREIMWSVERYSEQLSRAIKEKLAEFASVSQELDRTFPDRVVKQSVIESDVMLLLRLKELEELRVRYEKVGLYGKGEKSFTTQTEIENDTARKVFSVYIADMAQKLSLLEDMAAKIEVLLQVINRHLFKYKSMSIDAEKGFVFTNSLDKQLSPLDLSSGEQHELILLYELLFKVNKNSLILIDEPEISLHVAWQKKMLENLNRIIKLVHINVLIATHSPQIINNRWDLTVELGGGPNEE